MSLNYLLPIAVVVFGGMLLSTQGPINATLGRLAGDPVAAAAISFGVGFVILTAVTVARGAVPAGSALAAMPWWVWTGGLLGAYYVFAILWAVPKLGVLTVVSATVFGQLVAALALDAIGAFGVPVQPISLARIGGVMMVFGGVLLSRL
ncbi:DMT family transporter [Oceaniradius stylonematis]|jgi:transporter family-2 protein|uniref:DMT family transporter n=1 Tax=Oceaniradius stylonematis TaxID=2184161 RepID=UPI000F3F1020|nr:MAG: DMT family transporter [Oricola sp.]